jgi:hypothetical protein
MDYGWMDAGEGGEGEEYGYEDGSAAGYQVRS